MEAVRIMCQLSEAQISKAVGYVSSVLPTNIADLSDVDELMFMDSIRVCVDFDVDALGNLKVLSAEILDRDWDVLDTDSFAFGQYLKPIISDYNARSKESKKQNRQILTDKRAFQPT